MRVLGRRLFSAALTLTLAFEAVAPSAAQTFDFAGESAAARGAAVAPIAAPARLSAEALRSSLAAPLTAPAAPVLAAAPSAAMPAFTAAAAAPAALAAAAAEPALPAAAEAAAPAAPVAPESVPVGGAVFTRAPARAVAIPRAADVDGARFDGRGARSPLATVAAFGSDASHAVSAAMTGFPGRHLARTAAAAPAPPSPQEPREPEISRERSLGRRWGSALRRFVAKPYIPVLALLLTNVVYGSSFVAARVALAGMGPATLTLIRVLVGAAVLAPFVRRAEPSSFTWGDHLKIAAMGVVGISLGFMLGNVGVAASTATNAALLAVVEPVALMLLGPVLSHTPRLAAREIFGAVLAIGGATLAVVNGIPGLTAHLMPHWRGDALLVLSGLAYAAYSLISDTGLLKRHSAGRVTVAALLWGAAAILPMALAEWFGPHAPAFTGPAVGAALYLGLAGTAFAFFAWTWAVGRLGSARAAISQTLQPAVGVVLGAFLLGEAVTPFTAGGAALIVTGLFLALKKAARR